MADETFRAMGSMCSVSAVGGATGGTKRARSQIEALERRWTRFVPDSEVSRLNRRAGRATLVSETTASLLQRSMYCAQNTNGLFDPLLLNELVDAGYDTSLAPPAPDAPIKPSVGGTPIDASDGRLIALDDHARVVQLPPHRSFDPGGLGKGYAADLAAVRLVEDGAERAMVNLGGDIRLVTADGGARPLTIEIQDPWDPTRVMGEVRLASGAVATSSTLRRRWRNSAGEMRHHLLDPRTGQPAQTDIVAATVVAGEAWWAEALAKAAVIGGGSVAHELVSRHGAVAVLVHDDGGVTTVGRSREAVSA